MTAHRFHTSRPHESIEPHAHRDAHARMQHYGEIQPMDDPYPVGRWPLAFVALALVIFTVMLFGLDGWCAWAIDNYPGLRAFVEQRWFTALALIGAAIVVCAPFVALAIIFRSRPTGRNGEPGGRNK